MKNAKRRRNFSSKNFPKNFFFCAALGHRASLWVASLRDFHHDAIGKFCARWETFILLGFCSNWLRSMSGAAITRGIQNRGTACRSAGDGAANNLSPIRPDVCCLSFCFSLFSLQGYFKTSKMILFFNNPSLLCRFLLLRSRSFYFFFTFLDNLMISTIHSSRALVSGSCVCKVDCKSNSSRGNFELAYFWIMIIGAWMDVMRAQTNKKTNLIVRKFVSI